MKLEKAIEILIRLSLYNLREFHPNAFDAIGLGIEALKRCKYLSEHTTRWADVPLPGETIED